MKDLLGQKHIGFWSSSLLLVAGSNQQHPNSPLFSAFFFSFQRNHHFFSIFELHSVPLCGRQSMKLTKQKAIKEVLPCNKAKALAFCLVSLLSVPGMGRCSKLTSWEHPSLFPPIPTWTRWFYRTMAMFLSLLTPNRSGSCLENIPSFRWMGIFRREFMHSSEVSWDPHNSRAVSLDTLKTLSN